MKIYLAAIFICAVLFTVASCEDDKSTTISAVEVGVDFGAGARSSLKTLISMETQKFALESTDCTPPVEGCSVVSQTPTQYNIAFKSIFLKTEEGERVYLFDHDGLNSIPKEKIFEFDSDNNAPIQIVLPEGTTAITGVTGIGFEIYYVEIELKAYGAPRLIRIYMSDDDFAHHGNGGHHQGDITYQENGTEYWAQGATNWFTGELSSRGAYANGAGGIDPETGHERGMFGNEMLWNSPEFMQGANNDIFVLERGISGSGSSLTLTFDVTDTWSFEDYDGDGSFDPCEAEIPPYIEACSVDAHWNPVFPLVSALN